MSIERDGMPASIDSERNILGALLLDSDHYFDDLTDLSEEDFMLDSHRKIYAVMAVILNGTEDGITHVDYVTVMEALKRRKWASVVGGVAYVMSLTENLPRRASIAEYVVIVKEKARLRRLIHIASGMMKRAADQVDPASQISADLQDDLIEEAAESPTEAVRIGAAIPAVRARIERGRKISEEQVYSDMTWGVEEMDAFTKGLFRGEMTVVAGESGGFKTALLGQAFIANARKGINCALMSVEMPKEQMALRLFPQMGDFLTSKHTREPRLMNLEHVAEFERLAKEMDELPIWIDDSVQDIKRLIARMRMLRRKHNILLFGIDYFQLIQPDEDLRGPEKFMHMAFALRDFAKAEPDTHTLVLSQYAKSGGGPRKGKRQERSREDVYGGQALHHAAHNVVLVKVESGKEKEPNQLLEADLDIDKQRNGATGTVRTMLDRDFLRFGKPKPLQQQAFGGLK